MQQRQMSEVQSVMSPLPDASGALMQEYRKGFIQALNIVLTLPQQRIDLVEKMRSVQRRQAAADQDSADAEQGDTNAA